MSEEAVATASVKAGPRCEGCRDIKRKRGRALEGGDMQEAAALTTAMGVHLRVTHEYP
ncbi:hypothetical protein WEB32_22145 [Streptomyces netropsis]|uniref:hypothetical protein n=1 Tax=Streptomyces netropsis TaxID=55404 RepID=UPI0030CD4B3A